MRCVLRLLCACCMRVCVSVRGCAYMKRSVYRRAVPVAVSTDAAKRDVASSYAVRGGGHTVEVEVLVTDLSEPVR